MNKLFNWTTFGFILLTAVLDLIALPKADFGAGFMLAFVYFVVLGYFTTKEAK